MADSTETVPKLTPEAVVGEQVKELRDRQGWTQAELAHRAGMLQQTLARLEKGKRGVSVTDLYRLAAALNVAPVELLAGSFKSGDVPIADGLKLPAAEARQWICGVKPLPGGDDRLFYKQKPHRGEDADYRPGYANLALAQIDMEAWQEGMISGDLDQTEFAIRRLDLRIQNGLRELQQHPGYYEPGRVAQRNEAWGETG